MNESGLQQYRQAAFPAALQQFLAAVKLDATNPEYANNAGMSYLQMGDAGRAAPFFQQALELKPDEAMYHYNIGLAFQAAQDREMAVAAVLISGALRPDYFDAHAYAGALLFEAGVYSDAVESWERAVAIRPEADLLSNLGVAYMQLDDLEAADRVLRESIAKDPGYADAYYNMGVLRQKQRNNDAAVQNYRKALQLDPNKLAAYMNLGLLLMKQKDRSGAAHNFEEFIRRAPPDAMPAQIADARKRLAELVPRR